MKTCVYCGKELIEDNIAKEHIIPNGIGGYLESDVICCRACNSLLGETCDCKFVDIFTPLLSDMPNLRRDRGSKKYRCTGYALHEKGLFEVQICNKKITSCPELSKEERRDVSKDKFTVIAKKFNLNDTAFKEGLCKIAFNFAASKGIALSYMKDGVEVNFENSRIQSIHYNFPVIPFYPLNIIDEELECKEIEELLHMLILFTFENELWCYIELFTTFQFYVRLSTIWDLENEESFYIQKLERKFKNEKMDDNEEKFSLNDGSIIVPRLLSLFNNSEDVDCLLTAQKYTVRDFYISEDKKLFPNKYRQITFDLKNGIFGLYPREINELLIDEKINPQNYTFVKFHLLERYLQREKENA